MAGVQPAQTARGGAPEGKKKAGLAEVLLLGRREKASIQQPSSHRLSRRWEGASGSRIDSRTFDVETEKQEKNYDGHNATPERKTEKTSSWRGYIMTLLLLSGHAVKRKEGTSRLRTFWKKKGGKKGGLGDRRSQKYQT